jgi:antimicrobial peptide system SdpA family protein
MSALREPDKTARASSTQGLIFTGCLLLLVFAVSLTQLLPASVLPPWSTSLSESLAAVWPQGWDFFAHEPDGDVVVAFAVGAQGQEVPANVKTMSSATDWGLNRAALAQYVEMGVLGGQVPDRDWLDCESMAPDQCRTAALRSPAVRLIDQSRSPTLCGHVLLTLSSPLRWTGDTQAWVADWKILKIVNAEVSCTG